jgi:hypothetical protein
VVITPDEKKSIANSVARMTNVGNWEQLSVSSLFESSGQQLQKAVHTEQASKGLGTCFEPPY